MIIPKTTKGIVQQLLGQSAYSKSSLARAVGVSRHTVGAIVRGTVPTPATAMRFLYFYAAQRCEVIEHEPRRRVGRCIH